MFKVKLQEQINNLEQQNNKSMEAIIRTAKRNDHNTLYNIKSIIAQIERNQNYIEAIKITLDMLANQEGKQS